MQSLIKKYKMFRTAYWLACEAHKDDLRSDRKPYMSHVDAVIRGVDIAVTEETKDILFSVAALHDVFEDHGDKYPLDKISEILLSSGAEKSAVRKVITSVDAISKKAKGVEEYYKYVLRVSRDVYAKFVKISDLKHNMSDLKPGNMLDKYSLTLAFLEGKLD